MPILFVAPPAPAPQAQIEEEYVLMSEPDHIFLRPIPNFMKARHFPGGGGGWGAVWCGVVS